MRKGFLTVRNDFLEILQSKISKKSFRAFIFSFFVSEAAGFRPPQQV
jgi:hypothetical protein